MTLIEIMAVIGIMAFVFGASVALLKNVGRGNELSAVGIEVSAQLRWARSKAINDYQRVELTFDIRNGVAAPHVRDTVGYWSFEDDPQSAIAVGAFGRNAQLGANTALVRNGFSGQGLATGRNNKPGFAVVGTRPAFDCAEGVHLTADVYPIGQTACSLIAKEEAYFLGIDDMGHLIGGGTFRGTMVFDDGSKREDSYIEVYSRGVLPTSQWSHVEMILDGRGVRLFIDGVPQDMAPVGDKMPPPVAPGTPPVVYDPSEEDIDDVLSDRPFSIEPNNENVTLGGGPSGVFNGVLDNIRIMAVAAQEAIHLPTFVYFALDPSYVSDDPDDVAAVPVFWPETYRRGLVTVYFTPEGYLDPKYHTRPVVLYIASEAGGSRRILIELMGTTQ